MKLGFFDFVTHFGGAQRSTVEMIGRVAQHADIVILDAYGCCPAYRKAATALNVEYIVLRPLETRTTIARGSGKVAWLCSLALGTPGLVRLANRLRGELRRLRLDVAWTNSLKGLTLLNSAARGLGTKVVFFARGQPDPSILGKFTVRIMRHQVRGFFAQSELTTETLVQAGIDPNRIFIVPNAVEVSELVARARRPLDVPLPGEQSVLRLLLPATLVPGKGHLCAIRAVASLSAQGHDAVLWLAGDVPPGAGSSYSNQIRDSIAKAGLQKRVLLLGWRRDLPQVIQRASMVVLPSHAEGMPRILMEAMALGTPTAATPVGAVTKLIANERTGWLFEPEDHESLARCVLAASDEAVRSQTVRATLELITTKYSPAIQVRAALAAFKEVL